MLLTSVGAKAVWSDDARTATGGTLRFAQSTGALASVGAGLESAIAERTAVAASYIVALPSALGIFTGPEPGPSGTKAEQDE